jgi:hypothetical protein
LDNVRLHPGTPGTPATLEVRRLTGVTVIPQSGPGYPDTIQFNTASPVPNMQADNREAIGPGAYVVIGDDATNSSYPGYYNGWVLRIGNAVSTAQMSDGSNYPNSWTLVPGGDLSANDPGPPGTVGGVRATGINANVVYVVGRTLNQNTGLYDGPVQDVGVFAGTVPLR